MSNTALSICNKALSYKKYAVKAQQYLCAAYSRNLRKKEELNL